MGGMRGVVALRTCCPVMLCGPPWDSAPARYALPWRRVWGLRPAPGLPPGGSPALRPSPAPSDRSAYVPKHTHTKKWGYKNGEGTEGAAVRSTETLRCVGPRAEEAEGRPHGGRSSSQRTLSNWSGSAAPWGSHCRIFFPHHCGSEIPIASFKFPAPISFSSSHLTAPLSQPLGQFPVPSSPCSQLPTPS